MTGIFETGLQVVYNYSDKNKCHSGIYKRLDPDKPSVVISNYRKNMLIHPFQDRGLSVREAARLQSFPDNFIFEGKGIAFGLKDKCPKLVFVVGSVIGEKATLTIMLGEEIVAQGVNASKIIREAAKEINGGGGGQPFFATAGGKNPAGIEKAIFKAVELVKEALKK